VEALKVRFSIVKKTLESTPFSIVSKPIKERLPQGSEKRVKTFHVGLLATAIRIQTSNWCHDIDDLRRFPLSVLVIRTSSHESVNEQLMARLWYGNTSVLRGRADNWIWLLSACHFLFSHFPPHLADARKRKTLLNFHHKLSLIPKMLIESAPNWQKKKKPNWSCDSFYASDSATSEDWKCVWQADEWEMDRQRVWPRCMRP
jgi:hypothetical protein